MVDAHLAALSEKHANLESQIDQEVHRPLPDELLIAQWKKEKIDLHNRPCIFIIHKF